MKVSQHHQPEALDSRLEPDDGVAPDAGRREGAASACGAGAGAIIGPGAGAGADEAVATMQQV